jgi:hypothetical protein
MCIPPAVEPWRGLIPQIATLDDAREIHYDYTHAARVP